MSSSIPVQFPSGEILDREAVVWTTLAPGTTINGSLIVGTCAGDPLDLTLAQVTIDRDRWRRDLLAPGQEASFPLDRGFVLAVTDLNEIDQIAWSLAPVPIRITARVRRTVSRPLASSTVFQLVLLARSPFDERGYRA